MTKDEFQSYDPEHSAFHRDILKQYFNPDDCDTVTKALCFVAEMTPAESKLTDGRITHDMIQRLRVIMTRRLG